MSVTSLLLKGGASHGNHASISAVAKKFALKVSSAARLQRSKRSRERSWQEWFEEACQDTANRGNDRQRRLRIGKRPARHLKANFDPNQQKENRQPSEGHSATGHNRSEGASSLIRFFRYANRRADGNRIPGRESLSECLIETLVQRTCIICHARGRRSRVVGFYDSSRAIGMDRFRMPDSRATAMATRRPLAACCILRAIPKRFE